MNKIIFILLISNPLLTLSQNVGIGTSTPAARLQINHRSSSAPGLALIDSATNFGGTLEFRNNNNTRRMLMQGFAASNFNNGQYLDIRSDSVYAATFKGNGYVGIRNTDPSYPLDINGDINTSGSLRANGNAGTDGQVLQSNGNGTMNWVDMCEYKNYEIYSTVGSFNWIVPAGVTKICIELWGGGGGGSNFGGGGGGGYIKAYFTVTPSSFFSFTIGSGGAAGNGTGTNGSDGTSTSATVGAVTISANGGSGSIFNGFAEVSGIGGDFSATAGFRNYLGYSGQNGKFNEIKYEQKNATTFIINTKFGDGGDAGNSINTGAKGSYLISNESTGVQINRGFGIGANVPGGGGSPVFFGSFSLSISGAKGQMIIHY